MPSRGLQCAIDVCASAITVASVNRTALEALYCARRILRFQDHPYKLLHINFCSINLKFGGIQIAMSKLCSNIIAP